MPGLAIGMLLLGLAVALLVHVVYRSTQESYSAVGFNNGSIQANSEVIQVLRANVAIPECGDVVGPHAPVEVASAKAHAVYLVKRGERTEFCEYP